MNYMQKPKQYHEENVNLKHIIIIVLLCVLTAFITILVVLYCIQKSKEPVKVENPTLDEVIKNQKQ
jgi:hypothetical protein